MRVADKRPDTQVSDDAASDASSSTASVGGVPTVLSVKAAAAALGIDQRLMLDWISKGYVPGAVQFRPRGKYWVPTESVQRLAEKFLLEPDWEAAIDVGP